MSEIQRMQRDNKLVTKDSGKEIQVGDTVTTFRGEEYTLEGVYPHDGRTGKVKLSDGGYYYASVIDAKFSGPDFNEVGFRR